MLSIERQARITELIREKHMVTVAELMEMFSVSDMTIRRDLDVLERKGIVRKVYGGAVLADMVLADYVLGAPKEHSMIVRETARVELKRAIAKEAVSMIQAEDVILLDAGSTTLQIAKELQPSPDLVVITNSIPIALELMGKPVTLHLIGGDLRAATQSTVGPKAKAFLSDLRARKLFLGATALSLETGLMNFTLYEAEVKQQMMQSADQVILVADSSKFDTNSYYAFAQWKDVDVFITDAGIDPRIVRQLEERGVQVVVAGNAGASDIKQHA
ncbi:MAG: DeoR/GlpR family DNA-binding transcription regulator [Alicyclobacillus sp.]|nr:DeoR/GlpR family DNA-binding transcription regulator [Alicyclobacillus sp.]